MKVFRTVPVLMLAAATLVACSGSSKEELQISNSLTADSVSSVHNELLQQVMEGTRFVNEINKELAKARVIGAGTRQLQPTAELVDVNEERKQVVARISQLVTRLDQVQARLATARTQLAEKDSTLAAKVAEYELMVAGINQAAEQQRAEFQAVIDSQTAKIASLSKQVDTLSGTLGQLTSDHNAVYVTVGTKAELIKKGVLVPEGAKRFGIVGPRPLVPARELDSSAFTKIDRMTDSTIILPDGVYKIVSRQNTAHATRVGKGGKVAGAFKIDQPEQFWSTSRFLILVRS
jgi:multidrug efflux pump subunit AcrA (membrane-fusion protein)